MYDEFINLVLSSIWVSSANTAEHSHMMTSIRIMTAQLPSVESVAARRHSVWRTCCQKQDDLGRRASERRSVRSIAPADALLKSLGGAASDCRGCTSLLGKGDAAWGANVTAGKSSTVGGCRHR